MAVAESPIKRVRLKRRETLEEFSAKAGVHIQALYLNEQGVYPNILPKVLTYLASQGEDVDALQEEYLYFQEEKRRAIGRFLHLSSYVLQEPRFEEGHPFVSFRESLNGPYNGPLSRMAFAKRFCVHPALLYNLEQSVTKSLPEQLRYALTTAGLPDIVLQELNARCEEYTEGGWAFRASG